MDVFEGMFRMPLDSPMVFAAVPLDAANAVESKPMLAAPAIDANLSASRRLHAVAIIPLDVIVRVFTASVAVMVCVPGVARLAWNIPVPLISVAGAGSVALGSVLVNVIVPE